MDRKLVYPSSIPLDVDILQPQQRAMIAFGYLMRAAFGTTTLFDGLACSPTTPASMQVVVGPGSVITSSVVEATPYGSIAANTQDPLVKMGINWTSTTFSLTAPTNAGQSQNYLIQGTFVEQDTNPVVLPYYNSANPAQPFTGPNGSGTPQNTERRQIVNLQLKAGSPANAGLQATPPVDAGWSGLWVITVSTGQTSITSSAISMHASAPFISVKIPALAPKDTPTFTGIPRSVTPPLADNSTRIPTTEWVRAFTSAGGRLRLTGNLNLYVSSTGNDSNTGLTSGAPFLTLQKAIDTAYKNYDVNGFSVTINITSSGTYAPFLCSGPLTGQTDGFVAGIGDLPSFSVVGNIAAPSSIVISATAGNAVQVQNNARLCIAGFQVTATGTGPYAGNGVLAANGGYVVLTGAMSFGACQYAHLESAQSSTISMIGSTPYTIVGGGRSHVVATGSSTLIFAGSNVTLTGTPAFTEAFANAGACSTVSVTNATFTGSATGPRYLASNNSVVFTNGASATYFPGNANGVLTGGGVYS